jgi:cation diffusion facilitator CzcD-associated flavoprotein CzcO
VTSVVRGGETEVVDIVVVGSGFAGLAMAVRLREAGFSAVVVLERGDEVGGTWRDNTYPGAACDVPSHLYSFSFAPNPDWSRSFSGQTEILDYLRRTAARSGVAPLVRFGHEVTAARWDAAAGRWQVTSTGGAFSTRYLIGAMGPLAEPQIPDIPGVDRFEGATWHSARWNHGYDLSGKRVAVVGTGASAVQLVPQIQPLAGHLDLYQRTPPWVMARRDRAITRVERRLFRLLPAAQLAVRASIYWARECFFLGFRRAPALLWAAQRRARRQLRSQVPDRALRAKLTPSYALGCKRVLLSNDYYPALTQPNVDVVAGGIDSFTRRGVVDSHGVERPADVVIFATGFHATDPPQMDTLWGRDGVSLREAWAGGMSAYKGTAVARFPNLFILVGPNTGLGHNSMVYMIESQVAYVVAALLHMRAHGLGLIEVRAEAEKAWNEQVQRDMAGTVWMTGGCASWYLDASGRNTTLWPGFSFEFRRALRRFDPGAYELAPAPAREPVPAREPLAPALPVSRAVPVAPVPSGAWAKRTSSWVASSHRRG